MRADIVPAVGLAVAAAGNLAWEAASVAAGGAGADSALGVASVAGLALAAWAFLQPLARTGPAAAGLALATGAQAWGLGAALPEGGYALLPRALALLALLGLAWGAFVTPAGAWSAESARGLAPWAALAAVASAAWLPLNLRGAGLMYAPGTALAALGYAALAAGLLLAAGARLPRVSWKRRARAA